MKVELLDGYACDKCSKLFVAKADPNDKDGYPYPEDSARECCQPEPVHYLVCPKCKKKFLEWSREDEAKDHLAKCCEDKLSPEEIYLEQLRFGSRPLLDITRERFYAEREAAK